VDLKPWAGHAAYMGEKRNAYRILVGKPKERTIRKTYTYAEG
jgi:hypothetical protein